MVALEDVHLHSETSSSNKLQFIRMKLTDHSHKTWWQQSHLPILEKCKNLERVDWGNGQKIKVNLG